MFKTTKSIIIAFFLILTLSTSARATTQEASSFINDLADRVITIIKKQDISTNDKESQLNSIFLQSIDTKWIGRFAMGRYWRAITPAQQTQFLDLYSNYLIGIYVPNFRKYTGNTIKILGATETNPGEYSVQTELTDATNTTDVKIEYRLLQKEGFEKFIIFDIVAEGVSLITTQRAEINSVMSNEGFDSMIEKLTQKTSQEAK